MVVLFNEKKMMNCDCNVDCCHLNGDWVNETWNGQVEVVSYLCPFVEESVDVGESVFGTCRNEHNRYK